MKFFLVFPYYLYWHYTKGFKELLLNIWNFIVFETHFFSIVDLLKTLFAPFQRVKENYSGNIFDIENFFTALVVNTITRTIGFVARSIILFVGFICITCSIILIPFIMLIWLILPFAILFFIGVSFWAYITNKP